MTAVPNLQQYVLVPQYTESSSSAPTKTGSLSLSPVLPLLSSKFHATNESTLFTHVNSSSLGLGSNSKRGKPRKKEKGKELSMTGSNDTRIPWLKQLNTRAIEIKTIETLPVSTSFTSSGAVPTFGAVNFTISQITDVSSFTALFDQYRIDLIEVLMEPQVTEVTTAAADVGEYISVVDIDDSNVPTSYGDLCSYSTAQQSRGSMSHYHRFVPGVAVAVYSGAFTSFASTTSMWLDCGSPTIQHYGIKLGALTAPVTQSYFMNVRLHVSWRARH